jgi:hypothetical protein
MRAIEGLFRRSDDHKVKKPQPPRLSEREVHSKIEALKAEIDSLTSALDHIAASELEELSPTDQKLANKLGMTLIKSSRYKKAMEGISLRKGEGGEDGGRGSAAEPGG